MVHRIPADSTNYVTTVDRMTGWMLDITAIIPYRYRLSTSYKIQIDIVLDTLEQSDLDIFFMHCLCGCR